VSVLTRAANLFAPVANADSVYNWLGRELSKGSSGARIAIDMANAEEISLDVAGVCEFEALVKSHRFAARVLGLCLYDRACAAPKVICGALRIHHTVVIGDSVCPNPFCEPPMAGAEPGGEAVRARWMIAQLEAGAQRDELVRARDAALETSRLKSVFIANMSHDLRTPLNVILGYCDVIAKELSDDRDPILMPELEAINRAGKRLNTTIQGILDSSRIESDALELQPTELELGFFLQQQVRDFRALAERKGLTLKCILEAPGAMLKFDEYCLAQALTNLLDNAIKFTECGDIIARLYRDVDDVLTLEVKDTGVGIAADYLPRLFEPFSQEQTGYTRPFRGSGLGLPLTRRYLELNGASISVSSEKGRGTTFAIRFARVSEAVRRIGSRAVNSNATALQPGTDARTVMVVDDDPDTQAFMTTLLRPHCAVITVACEVEARRELEARPAGVDMILMDLTLADGEDGTELTRRFRSDMRWKTIPIVALTAHANEADRERALAAGCDDYLAKPVDRRKLFPLIDSLTTH
jgi:signal transduction histidine kinase/CheY-like chemotaxis protein